MKRSFDVVIERDEEGFYVASVPAGPGCHTQAKSMDELTERIREASPETRARDRRITVDGARELLL